ncbi:ThiF family adenylyltransferase [Candidatus Nomurabacteria bacterium]|nr:ThiF family adenylyltransferase [Candidatus Nomurabacteria bacterium]
MTRKQEYKPVILSEIETKKLMKNKSINFVDAFSFQVKELFIIKNPEYAGPEKEKAYQTREFADFSKKIGKKYVYVFYPWNFSLVKTVQKKDYLELKTNRNRDLITEGEQTKLRKAKIAVFGMSVGSNIALVLTQAGISNEITISDFDSLDTTNLNRIIAGVHQVGLSKCAITARHIYEDNPFAKITVLSDGVNKKNIENLLRHKKLDLIVDEVDNMAVKIDIRVLAQKYKVPVVMVTDNGESIVLHIERYDLAHKKIFGKELAHFESFMAPGIAREKVAELIISDIVGGINKVDKRMIKSVSRVIKKELVSWPQLGSAAILAGVMATYAIKQIILGYDKRIDVRGHISPLGIQYGTHNE